MMERLIGLVTGAVVGLLLTWVILRVTKTNQNARCEFDERQQLARANGYKYGFWTLLTISALYGFSEVAEVSLPVEPETVIFLAITFALVVQASYWIWHDAYFALNENRTRAMIALALVSAFNLWIGASNVQKNGLMEDGKLSGSCVNLICGAQIIAICAVLWAKQLNAKGAEDEEE